MIEIDLNGRTPKELRILKDQIMISGLSVKDKDRLISKIESVLGIRHTREDILKMIDESKPDIDDIGD